MKITVKNSWDDITLADLERISQLNEVKMNEEVKMMEMFSILTNIETDELMQMPAKDILSLAENFAFLTTPIPQKVVKPKLKIGDNEFYHVLNMNEITAAQFLDYKILLAQNEIDKKIARLVACFTVPVGHSYNDGYNTEEVIDLIHNNLSVVEGQSLVDFFMVQFKAYSVALLSSSIREMKKQMKKLKTHKEKMEMKAAIEVVKKAKDEISAKSFGRL